MNIVRSIMKYFCNSSVEVDLKEARYQAQSDVEDLLKGERGHIHGITFTEAAAKVVKQAENTKEPKRKTKADLEAIARAKQRRYARGQTRLDHTPHADWVKPPSDD